MTVCWGKSEREARKTAHQWWPNTALAGQLSQELRCVEHFDQAVETVTEDQVAEKVVCGPDPRAHLQAIEKFVEAGFTHVYVHQIGPDQKGFFEFYQESVIGQWTGIPASR